MDFTQFIQNIQISSSLELGWADLFLRLSTATIMGFYITFISYIFYTGSGFRQSIAHAQILLTIICAMIINVIGQNIAWAIGLIGALSFIRFRTNLKDPKDTAIFFYSVGTGIACGAGAFRIALGGILVLSIVLFVLFKVSFFQTQSYELKLKGSTKEELEEYTSFLSLMKIKNRLLESSTKKEFFVILVFWNQKNTAKIYQELMHKFPGRVLELGQGDED
jgi:uncharacterized membrane protein YhiD involved in acid resistance